ncbi:MAG: hypothetical protein MOB07_29250 [Acidobacteria bacterium]|nr:hypothetical protein [Acidobacteriota bacterium]
MLALFRSPLLCLLGRLWWLPALTLVAAWGLGGERGLRTAGLGVAGYLAVVAGIVGAAWAHGAYSAFRERVRHRSADQRFLCPDCLHFGDFDFACGACGKRVEAFLVHTSGAYINDCPHCHEYLLPHDGSDGRGVRAYCKRCQGNCDLAIYHERQIHVLATLLPADFISLRQITAAREGLAKGGVGYARDDDGVQLTYLLNLDSLTDAARNLPRRHALWELKSIWLVASGGDINSALIIGRAIDTLNRRTDDLTKTLTVCVPQTALGSKAKNLLEDRFKAVEYGVAAADFLRGETKNASAPQVTLLPSPINSSGVPTPPAKIEQAEPAVRGRGSEGKE